MPLSSERSTRDLHPELGAVILAGGASTRMGVDKAFLTWRGVVLLRQQIEHARTAGASSILISGRKGVDYADFGCPVVYDSVDGAGPLAGLTAALRMVHATHQWLLALAVDLPLMTSAFLGLLIAKSIESGKGAVPKRNAYFEPLAAVYPVGATLAIAETQLAAKQFALQKLAAALIAQGHASAFPLGAGERMLFANWNDAAGPLPAGNA